jgi:hypothetical protein
MDVKCRRLPRNHHDQAPSARGMGQLTRPERWDGRWNWQPRVTCKHDCLADSAKRRMSLVDDISLEPRRLSTVVLAML